MTLRITDEGILAIETCLYDNLSFETIPDYGVDLSFQRNYVQFSFYDSDGDVSFRVLDADTKTSLMVVKLNSVPQDNAYFLSVAEVAAGLSVKMHKNFRSFYSLSIAKV